MRINDIYIYIYIYIYVCVCVCVCVFVDIILLTEQIEQQARRQSGVTGYAKNWSHLYKLSSNLCYNVKLKRQTFKLVGC